jgi:hypothetical protein
MLWVLGAARAAAAGMAFAVFGGAGVPLGDLAGANPGHFNWLRVPPDETGRGRVDIRGFRLTGSSMAVGPAVSAAIRWPLAGGWEFEVGGGRYFLAPRSTWVKDGIHNPETSITALGVGARYGRRMGRVTPAAEAGFGYYLGTLTLDAAGSVHSGFAYDEVYTLDKTVDINGPGGYVGGGVSYALTEHLAAALDTRYHYVFNGKSYSILIHEKYGYEPYHYTEYVFPTSLDKAYDDQFFDVRAGLVYAVF